MKSTLTFYLLLCLAGISCGENKTSSPEDSTAGNKKPPSKSPIDCYRFANEKDTIILKLIHVGEAITGTLVYKLFEKDKNMGTIQGGMRGDVLIADYTFFSEGVSSSRQIAFKKDQDYFIEGFGDVINNGDKTVFKDPGSLQFNDAVKLKEVDCQK